MDRLKYVPLSLLTLAHLFFQIVIAAPASPQEIVLTFDDGPSPRVLEKLLPLLQQHGVPATFFIIGSVAVKHKDLLQTESAQGCEIENHTYGHDNLKKLLDAKGPEAVKASIGKTAGIIKDATGETPRFLRPPFWVITDVVEKLIIAQGYSALKLGRPDINTLDYEDAAKHRPVETLIKRVQHVIELRERRKIFTHVLTFHELPLTVEALKTLIPYFRGKGYRFVLLREVMNKSPAASGK